VPVQRTSNGAQSTVLAKVTGDKARSADDYIATIRRLRGEGKFEEAERELKAFRAAYPTRTRDCPPNCAGGRSASRAEAWRLVA
jgi:hypothetical protein